MILYNQSKHYILALVGKADFFKKCTQQKGKRRNKERGPKYEPEEQNPKVGGSPKAQRNKACSRASKGWTSGFWRSVFFFAAKG